jgi:hypothetical protein
MFYTRCRGSTLKILILYEGCVDAKFHLFSESKTLTTPLGCSLSWHTDCAIELYKTPEVLYDEQAQLATHGIALVELTQEHISKGKIYVAIR